MACVRPSAGQGCRMSSSASLENLVKGIRKIPVLPVNIRKINDLIDQQQMPLTDIGREISMDQSLSAQVLKLINSSFYGMSQPVSSIPHAVVLLGVKTVRVLVSSSFASSLIEKSIPGLYAHSLACARACSMLAKHLGLEDPDQYSTIGLLHDIGKVILAENLPDQFHQISEVLKAGDVSFAEAERIVFGVTHGDLGAWLLSKWNLPEAAIRAIACQHEVHVPDDYPLQASVLKLADLMVRAGCFGWPGDWVLPAVEPEVPQSLGLAPDDIKDLMHTILVRLDDIPRYVRGHD